ncbi:hypothetical protein [Streptomyces minutiscleroticus]|uniref:Uncharacterized protein n=1 Tax=Streptomyces minutiscleroticus TaxID=68238 RepID=A0A918U4W1_9ACTN|nr:hypothetical protein [Streptomyces minutiscleroticus]GGX92230.1 hypothetical protein GCM10010358_52640 [Streptomyces minutiscleroticus]
MSHFPQNGAVRDEATRASVTATDPAGEIRLVRWNGACARTRALAGMNLGSGVLVGLGSVTNTTVSVPA